MKLSLHGVHKWYLTSNLPAVIESANGLIPRDIKHVLHGISQVIIIYNSLLGIFILSILYVGGGALLGMLALSCTVVATILTKYVYSDVNSIKSGLEGYKPALLVVPSPSLSVESGTRACSSQG